MSEPVECPTCRYIVHQPEGGICPSCGSLLDSKPPEQGGK